MHSNLLRDKSLTEVHNMIPADGTVVNYNIYVRKEEDRYHNVLLAGPPMTKKALPQAQRATAFHYIVYVQYLKKETTQ